MSTNVGKARLPQLLPLPPPPAPGLADPQHPSIEDEMSQAWL